MTWNPTKELNVSMIIKLLFLFHFGILYMAAEEFIENSEKAPLLRILCDNIRLLNSFSWLAW